MNKTTINNTKHLFYLNEVYYRFKLIHIMKHTGKMHAVNGCIWWCASASTSWTGACEGPVQDSQIQDWPKATAFLGYDEVRAVKPLPHLGWRDRLDCILCQEDSNPLAQNRGVSDCHWSLENAAELGGSPGELNRIAKSKLTNAPAGRAG